MTHEQHQAIRAFVEHAVSGEQPVMDVEADAIIRALFVRNPDAAYRMTMLAMSLAERPGHGKMDGLPPEDRGQRKGWLSGIFHLLAPAVETVTVVS